MEQKCTIGFGAFRFDNPKEKVLLVRKGFTLIDTARVYGNEKEC